MQSSNITCYVVTRKVLDFELAGNEIVSVKHHRGRVRCRFVVLFSASISDRPGKHEVEGKSVVSSWCTTHYRCRCVVPCV